MSLPRLSREWMVPAIAGAIAIGLVAAPGARAQTVTTGAIRGAAVSTSGQIIAGVRVTMTHHATAWARSVLSDGLGAYRSPALLPGRYDIRAERLGYRPLIVLDVSVSPAAVVTLDLRLTPADPPVTQADTMSFVEGALHASLARGTWDPGTDLADLVDPLGRVSSVAALASATTGGLAMEGLPDRLGWVGVDGIPRTAAASPGVSRSDWSTLGLPLASLQHVELASGTDVEWPGIGGELLSAFSARGPRSGQVRGFADAGTNGYRGAVVAGGPVVRDTAWGLVGVDARRINTPLKSPWPDDTGASAVVAAAPQLSEYLKALTQQTDVITAFGRFDWEIARGQSIALRAAVTNATASDVGLGEGRFTGLGTSLDARDVSASLAFNSRFNARLGSEVSLAIDRSLRDYSAPSLPLTVLTADGLSAGADGAVPGRFERDATRASAALLYRLGIHALKFGAAADWTNHDITYDPLRSGEFLFGSTADLGLGRGAFVQSVGGVPDATFTISATAFFAQDSWSPVAGLDMLVGLRLEREHWPTGGVTPDADWLRVSGIPNQGIPSLKTQVNPRFSFVWSAGARRDWLLRGDAGTASESVDPSVLAEVLNHDGTAEMRRGVGVFGPWPAVPDFTAAPITGPVLSLVNSHFQAPRTSRAGFSIAHALASGTSVQVAGQYRHTDFLPRRTDLNLLTSPQFTDQFGRAIYGTLQQDGSLLVATPGSNRQFGAFDRVWALDPTGSSDYWGLTISLERLREQGLSVWASYTFSHTTDNLPGLGGSVPDAQMAPPLTTGAGTTDWRNGRSDLDVPHRALAGFEWSSGSVKLAGLVRYQSGLPFTPGFRDGVDANGDGAAGNDPAFVSDTVSGAAAVVGGQSCLKSQVGQFASRNSCRGPAVTSLDARLVIGLSTLVHAPLSLVVDGLNLVSTNTGVIDRALYLIDPTRALTTNGVGVVTVPLVANPNFGKVLARSTPGATVQAGLRFNF
ncbi:MAG TPA: carboxypeptidase-like regulatory domain-containing protein [Gemmatimonadales bacterium]|nr:carboxypeptidase-like regulatory domain-containing protein [Gemmatimonadales bacterium]